jgi:nicotinamide riboside kinase
MYKIAVIGPESTGKSALTKALAKHYSSPMVDEYARWYVEQLNRAYTFEDVCSIARKQIEDEKHYHQILQQPDHPAYVFFDTELIITKVWFEYCYQSVPDFVVQQLDSGFFDLYLLCDTDLPWEPDPVREHGHDRDFFLEWYRREIEHLRKPYVIIKGTGDVRTHNAIHAIEHGFKLTVQQF